MKILKYGSRGSLVELLQTALNRAGHGALDVDGSYGAQTRQAVLSLQRAAGIAPTGEARSAVWRALEPYTGAQTVHTLRQRETLPDVAEMHGATPEEISAANPGLDLLALKPGTKIVVPLPFEPVPAIGWSAYANAQSMRALTARYPFLKNATFGRSSMGRPLRYLMFGEGERTGVFTAAHHANEWITAPALLRYVAGLCADYAAGKTPAVEIFRSARLYFVPLVNPDGADLVTGALEEGFHAQRAKEIAADYPDVPFPDGWKANIRGTDLNLQYPADWEAAKEIKYAQGWVSPAPRDYVGSAPLAASESRALYSLTRQAAPSLALALHTQGEVIYWRYHGYAPPEAEELAEKLASASGYALDSVPDESLNAGYRDWVIDSLDIPAFTVECGLGESPLPMSQFEPIAAAVKAICAECAAWLTTA